MKRPETIRKHVKTNRTKPISHWIGNLTWAKTGRLRARSISWRVVFALQTTSDVPGRLTEEQGK